MSLATLTAAELYETGFRNPEHDAIRVRKLNLLKDVALAALTGDVTAAAGSNVTALAVVTASGAYTPTLTNTANLDASTAYSCQYSRVGSVVTVSGRVDVDPTLTATATQLGISLPIASALANANECAGTAFCRTVAGMGAAILGDATNDRAQMEWVSSDITNRSMFFQFSYRVA